MEECEMQKNSITEVFLADCEAVRKAWNGDFKHTKVVGMNQWRIYLIGKYLGLIQGQMPRKHIGEWYDLKGNYIDIHRKLFEKPFGSWKMTKNEDGSITVLIK